jgi:hypothetical protein
MSKEYTAFNCDSFWNDGYVQELDMAETAVYFHYITSPRLENSGVFKEGQRMVSFYVKTDIDTVKSADAKLEKDGKIFRIGEWVIIPSSLKHQKFDRSPNMIKGIYEQLKTVPVEALKKLQDCGYLLDLSPIISGSEIAEPLPNPSETLPLYIDIDLDQYPDKDSNSDQEKYSESGKDDRPKLVISLWQKNGDIFNAFSSFKHPKDWLSFWEKSDITKEQIKTAFKNYIQGIKSGAIERKYIPANVDTFVLNGWIQKSQEPYRKQGSPVFTGKKKFIEGKKSLGGLD